ncbi:MAG: hypothetical protein EKK33_05635 [Bradyrhizobiaceae bacterium]|nr:MAG: hypothetical protein EKK33_05635 [Bradyrhizobiaceae bacterium]
MDSSMTGDFEVAPLEAVEIWKYAKAQRRRLWPDADRIDLLSLEAATDIWTIDGMRSFQLRFVADEAMSGETGLTALKGDTIVVAMPARIRHRLTLGLGSARFALARELGYATLHSTHLTARVPSDTLERLWVSGPNSSRWQARFFASALLINDTTAWSRGNVHDVSIAAGIDLDAAQLYLADLCGALFRTDRSAHIQAIADEVRMALPASLAKQFQPPKVHCSGLIRNGVAQAGIRQTTTPAHETDRTELKPFQIREIAKVQRRRLGWDGREKVDPLELAGCTEIWTMDGVVPFRLEFFSGETNQTEFVDGTLVVRIADRTRQGAIFGDGCARVAIAREIARAALSHHRRKASLQVDGLYPNISEAELQAGRNRFEANIFASALMIEDEIALQLCSVKPVSLGAGIDPTVLLHYFYLLFQEGRRQSG